jgi:hypothetical protein
VSTPEDRALTVLLERVAADARPAEIPADLWSRGRRRHRWRTAATVAIATVVVAIVAMPVAVAWQPRPLTPAQGQPSVPSRVDPPLPWQSTAQQDPGGPATMIVTGPGGFGANDFFGYEDRALVIGRNGSYRWLQEISAFDAGESVLLSPDGRYVAGDAGIEGANAGDGSLDGTSIVDLNTGRVRSYGGGVPLAWSPLGQLLQRTAAGRLGLLDPVSGVTTDLGVVASVPAGSPFAFAPDGQRVAYQSGSALLVVDLRAKTEHRIADLGPREALAGPGAWSADGSIALWRYACQPSCQPGADLTLDLTYMDAARGIPTGPRFDPVHGVGARLLGRPGNGDAIVVVYAAAGTPPPDASTWSAVNATAPSYAHPGVVALHPGGGSTALVTVPRGADRVDIARDLLGRFGGPPPTLSARLLDWLGTHAVAVTVFAGIVALVVVVMLRRRRLGHARKDSLLTARR